MEIINLLLTVHDLIRQRRKKRRQGFLVGTNSHKVCRPANSKAIFKQPFYQFAVPSRYKETGAEIADALIISAFNSSFDLATA